MEQNIAELRELYNWLALIHVSHRGRPSSVRLLLVAGRDNWKAYLGEAAKGDRDIFAMIEFVRDDELEVFLKDAGTLREILNVIH